MRHTHLKIIACVACLAFACAAGAAPPTYKVLRRGESPGKHYQPGHPAAVMTESRATGYAYGYFGAPPRSHASRHFGYYRTYTQWSTW